MDVEAEWNTHGINGIHRFLIKLNNLASKIDQNSPPDSSFNSYLSAIGPMITSFHLNTVIAAAMKLMNTWEKRKAISTKEFEKFLITLSPIFPFITEELWSNLPGNPHQETIFKQDWPTAGETGPKPIKVLVNQKFIAELPCSDNEAELIASAKNLPAVTAKLKGDEKVIFRHGELINFVSGK